MAPEEKIESIEDAFNAVDKGGTPEKGDGDGFEDMGALDKEVPNTPGEDASAVFEEDTADPKLEQPAGDAPAEPAPAPAGETPTPLIDHLKGQGWQVGASNDDEALSQLTAGYEQSSNEVQRLNGVVQQLQQQAQVAAQPAAPTAADQLIASLSEPDSPWHESYNPEWARWLQDGSLKEDTPQDVRNAYEGYASARDTAWEGYINDPKSLFTDMYSGMVRDIVRQEVGGTLQHRDDVSELRQFIGDNQSWLLAQGQSGPVMTHFGAELNRLMTEGPHPMHWRQAAETVSVKYQNWIYQQQIAGAAAGAQQAAPQAPNPGAAPPAAPPDPAQGKDTLKDYAQRALENSSGRDPSPDEGGDFDPDLFGKMLSSSFNAAGIPG